VLPVGVVAGFVEGLPGLGFDEFLGVLAVFVVQRWRVAGWDLLIG
jgi:hypothetical protein